jgi:UDP:flavonoid glycosyltransferase YjiC (YdhE family)
VTNAGRFLVVSWDGGGNVPPTINLGARLVRGGHRVRMLGWSSTARGAAEAGMEFSGLSTPPLPPGRTHEEAWSKVMDPMLHGQGTVEEILAVARSFRPDVLVIDCMMGAAFAAAAQLALPTAVLVHVRYGPFVNVWGDDLMHTSTLGLLSRADLVLALTPAGFDDMTDAVPANTTYVGPILPPATTAAPDVPELTEPGEPWILLTLSTTEQHQRKALPAILEAVGALPVRVLLTLGGVPSVDPVTVPDNVTVRDFVPHDRVLPHMSAVVCHAGLSTVTTSLAHGVPLVCIPQGREQPLNAERVTACGVGRALTPDAPAAEIADAVRFVLTDAVTRRAADTFTCPDSGADATKLVEALLTAQDRTLLPREPRL